MKLKVTKSFDFAHNGCEVKTYAKGTEIDTETADPELVRVASEEGWAVKTKATKEPAAPPDAGKEPEPTAPAADAAGAPPGAPDT